MAHQQRQYQWPWMWIVCFGILGMTLAGCGASSSTSKDTQSTTIRVVFPSQQTRLWDQDRPAATAASSERLPARVLRQVESLARVLEVHEAQAQASPLSIADLTLRVTDAAGTPLPGLERVDMPLGTGRVTVHVPLGPGRVFLVEAFPACPGSVRARNFTGQTQADVPGGTTITIMMTPADEVVVAPPGDQRSTPGQAVAVAIEAGNSRCTPLTFSATNLPPGLSIDPSTGVITGTPLPGTAGTYTAIIMASDGTHSTTTTMTWTVLPPQVPLQVPLQVSKTGTGSGTVTSSPAGIDCGAACSALYDQGTPVTLTAAAASGARFIGWSGGGCTGTSPCTVTLTAATTVTATFNQQFTLTVSKAGTGSGTVTSTPAGIDCGAACSALYDSGTVVTLTAVAASGVRFAGWSGGGCTGTGPCTGAITAATTVTATFTQQFALTVSKAGAGSGTVTSTPAGIDCGAACTALYDSGTVVTLTATATSGARFVGWSGGGCTGTGPCTGTITAATTVTATFTQQFALTVVKAGTGSGTVTSSPGGINCETTCTVLFDSGTGVSLIAVAAPGSRFVSFSGDCLLGPGRGCLLTMNGPKSVTATFTQQFTLTVAKAGTGSGTVTSSPAGIDCGAACSALYDSGTIVSLTPTAATVSVFAGWSGGGCAGTDPCTMTLTAATTVTATFNLFSPRFAYVTNQFDDTVSMYIVDATTGQLRHNGYIGAQTSPVAVTVDPSGRFAYVANAGNFESPGTVSGYTINAMRGTLTPMAGSPFPAGTFPQSMTVDPSGRFAYVANGGSDTVSGYTIDATSGALTPMAGSPFPTGEFPQSMTVDSSGRFVYVANSGFEGPGNVSGYTINTTSGALTPMAGSPFPAGTSPVAVTVDPSGRFAYVANEFSDNVSGYTINATTGVLTPMAGSPFPAGTSPVAVTVDPFSRFVYVANGGNFESPGTVSGYTLNATSGALTPMAGSPFPAGVAPSAVTVDPSGRFAYVANSNADEVSGYTINAATGVLTAVGTVRTRGGPTAVALTRGTAPVTITPRFAYASNGGDFQSPSTISGYTINATSGALTPVAGSPFPAGTFPVSVTVDPSGRFAYTANFGDGMHPSTISGYTLNATSGALTPIAGSPFPAGVAPNAVTVDPSGRFAYVAHDVAAAPGTILGYTINAPSGALTPMAGSPFPTRLLPSAVAVDPSGRFAYVANAGADNVSGYTINATSGALMSIVGSPFPAGLEPSAVTVDPSGRFVYVANGRSSNVSGYTLNATSGVLTPMAGSPFPAGTFPVSVTVDPSGRFVYVANEGSSNVSGHTLNATSGVLTPMAGSPFSAGTHPLSVTVDASGRFAYTANEFSDNVSGYTINVTTGVLTPMAGSPFPAGTSPLSVITSGALQ